MSLRRRRFIQLSSLASASLFIPRFVQAFERRIVPSDSEKILIVIQLAGGNDGLNTIVPVRNDLYYQARPKLAIPAEKTLKLADHAALHPSLEGIRRLYDQGYVTVVNNVGYPDPDRSHFRSTDIWESGSSSREALSTGWLGRYLDANSKQYASSTLAIEIDDTLSLAMKGKIRKGLAVADIRQFHDAAADGFLKSISATHAQTHEEGLAGYLYRTLAETTSAADYVFEHTKTRSTSQVYPSTQLGKRMKTIATLIRSGAATKVFYVSHVGYDTHVSQDGRHSRLLSELDQALTALTKDLTDAGRFQDTLIMTFSEFGRRVAENASAGTDHGTAAPMFLIGGGLKKQGLYNDLPDLANLDNGDLKYQVDFRRVYATVLERWLDVRARDVLSTKHSMLDFI